MTISRFLQNVVKVVIYKRSTHEDRTSGLEVRVGDIDHAGTGHERFQANRVLGFYEGPDPDREYESFATMPSMPGRYVTVQCVKTASMELQEIYVHSFP